MTRLSRSLPAMVIAAMLMLPSHGWALPEDVCTNPAVPRSTPSSDFTLIGDGSMVRHETTGLEWQRCAVGQVWQDNRCNGSASTMTWQQALQAGAELGEGWRLPNINELRSIVEECRTTPAINQAVFPNTALALFWSASPAVGESARVWGVGFQAGPVGFSAGTDQLLSTQSAFRARLVREAR